MATESTAAATHGSGGLPQLDFATWPSQILWLVIALVALYVALNVFAVPKIKATIEERQDTIAGDLDLAAEYERKAREAESAYKAALEKARVEARRIGAKNQAEIKVQLDAAIAEVDRRIAERAADGKRRLGEIRDASASKASEVAREIGAAMVGRFGGGPDASRLDAIVAREIRARFGGAA